MDIFEQAAERIIREQEAIIGPVALEQARKVSGLEIGEENRVVMTGDKPVILDQLVAQYERLFGKTSVEVCKEAIGNLLPQFPAQQVPSLLR